MEGTAVADGSPFSVRHKEYLHSTEGHLCERLHV